MDAALRPDPPTAGWTPVATDTSCPGRPPGPRSLHAAAVLRDSLFVFGGYDGTRRVNDFHEFHFPTRAWREVVAVAPPPLRPPPQWRRIEAAAEEGAGDGGGHAAGEGPARGGGGHDHEPPPQRPTATGTPPSPRDRHAAVVHGSSFYVFGGFDGTSRVSDLHGFDVDSRTWREVWPRAASEPAVTHAPHDNGNGSGAEARGGRDIALDGAVAWPPPFPPALDPVPVGDAAALPLRFHPPPSPRHSHAAAVHHDSMYCFGGYDGSYRSDFHRFDFDQSAWRPVSASGRSPRARYRATAVVVPARDALVLFGGHDGTRHLADVHLFDFAGGAWSSLAAAGPPLPRDSHVSVVYEDSMYVFGGSTGSAMNDLYELNFHRTAGQEMVLAEQEAGRAHTQDGPETGGGLSSSVLVHRGVVAPATWQQVPPAGVGVAVHRFCHVGAVHRGLLYVFGGYDGTSRLNDFVALDLAAGRLRAADVPPPTLLADLRSFLDDEDVMAMSDITLMVEGVPVRAHRLMLVRSPYFRAMLLGDMAEASQKIVNLENVLHNTFLAVLEYLYTDDVAVQLESAMELFAAADLFDIPRLRAMCERRLLESMTVENAATVFLAADVHSAAALREKALGYILLHFEAVSTTVAFEDMVRINVELVFEILQNR